MVARGLFIVVVVAFVLVASSDVPGASAGEDEDVANLLRSLELVDQAIASPANNQVEATENVVYIVRKYTYYLDMVLPSDALARIFKWIKSPNFSIRTSGWKIMEVLAADKEYVKKAMELGLIDDILRSFETATGDEELYTLATLTSLIFKGYYCSEDSVFLHEKIIPILESRLSHENSRIAQKAAMSIRRIVELNRESVLQHLVKSDVVSRVIEQTGKRPASDVEFDRYLFDFVRFVVDRLPQYKSALAKLDIVSRINASLENHRGRKNYIDSIFNASLSMISSLVSGDADACGSLIKQGLPKLVLAGLRRLDTRHKAVMVLNDIVNLNKPELMTEFLRLEYIPIELRSYLFQIKRSEHPNDEDTVEKIKGILSAFE